MRKILLILCLALTLTGCKTVAEIKPDTIVDIPLHPTESNTQPTERPTEPEVPGDTRPTEIPAQTQPPTEAATEKPAAGSSGGKPAGSKPTGNTGSSEKPPATQPPVQKPTEPVTQPPTEPPTQPVTEPPTEAPTEPPTELPAPPVYDPAGYVPGSLDRAVADAVNDLRREAGLAELAFDDRLSAIASVRARELSLEWSHIRPDGSDGLTVLAQFGYSHSWAAENLFNGAAGGEKIAARWMSADSTAANILSGSAAVIGVGSFTTHDGLTCVAAIFAG